jgi:hypothetical protein
MLIRQLRNNAAQVLLPEAAAAEHQSTSFSAAVEIMVAALVLSLTPAVRRRLPGI